VSPRRRVRISPRRLSIFVGLLTLLGSMALLPAGAAGAATPAPVLTPGFNINTSTDTGLGQFSLTNFVFLPGTAGNVLATGKCGSIRLGTFNGNWTNSSWSWQAVTKNNLTSVYCNQGDRGLLGIAVDPTTFPTDKTVYLLFDYTNPSDGKQYGRLSKVTANSATSPTVLSNEQVILDGLPSYSASVPGSGDDSHTIGTVLVAPDHTLFVGVGDGSSYLQYDMSALNAQKLDNPRGKIFHINADGSGVSTNKHYSSSDKTSWASRTFAYGLRNPFRFTLRPGTSTLYIGDVGWNTWEEVDIAKLGAENNFGWPCFEGPFHTGGSYDTWCGQQGLPSTSVTTPAWYWDHGNNPGQPDAVTGSGDASVGGVYYTGGNYGPYNGAYFFGDYAWGRMWTMRTDGNDNVTAKPADHNDDFAENILGGSPPVGPVIFQQGPNGDIFIGVIGDSKIYDLRYTGANSNNPPSPALSVTPGGGPPSTVFTFSAAGSYDPDSNDHIATFHWNFGDGHTVDTPGTQTTVQHVYGGSPNVWTASLTATDSHGATSPAVTVPVNTEHSPPTITLTPNRPGHKYAVGETVSVTAVAKDDQGATLSGASIQWHELVHHCPAGVGVGGCHIHPGAEPTGTVATAVVPDHGDDMYLEFRATATDSHGLSTTASFNLPVDEHALNVNANVASVPMQVNAYQARTPVRSKAVTHSFNRVTAPTSWNGYVFVGWSNGSSNPTQSFAMASTDVTLSAVYAPVGTGAFTAVTPYRLFDTRPGAHNPPGHTGPLGAGQQLSVAMRGQAHEPSGATAALLNITVINPRAAGFLRAYPCGSSPTTSTVNFDTNGLVSNLALVRMPADGRICFWSMVPTDVVVDVSGWFAPATGSPAGSGYTGVTPARVLDTRSAALAPAGIVEPLVAGRELHVTLAGRQGMPANATAALLNVTVTNPRAAGYLRVYPCGAEQAVSNVNYQAGETVANLAAVKLSSGDVCFRSYAATDLVVDLAGWYAPGAKARLSAPAPTRLLDTRTPLLAPNGSVRPLAANQQLALQVTGSHGVPVGASSIALNVTVTNVAAAGYLRVYPCGTSPNVSNVNYRVGQTAAANLVVVKLPSSGQVCMSSFARVDLVVDLAGWYVG
jgi:glucose/arabinose dehydrogenase